MKRDGATQSIWQDEATYQPVNAWDRNYVYDALVIGGGITGITTALLLAEKGLKCILAEAVNLGFGTSGGTTAHLNTMLDAAYYEVERDFSAEDARLLATGAREAIDLVEGLITRHDISCSFSYEPGYLFARNKEEEEELDKIKSGAERAGIVTSYSDTIPVPVPFTRAIRFEFQGQFHASKYLHGLAAAFEKRGGVILQQCMVGELTEEDHFIADTTLGEIFARKVVYATHIPPGINILHFRNAPYRSYAMGILLRDPRQYPAGLVYDLEEPYHYYRTHVIRGRSYLIAGGNDHKAGHVDNTNFVFTELEGYLRQHFSIESIDYRWSSQYYVPADGLPYIGLLPGHERVYCATGFNGNGMTLGTLAAKIICEQITDCPSKYEQLFNPARIKPVAGFTAFVKENADVVSKFIGMRFSYDHIRDLAELAPGEGRLVEYEGHKLAMYKDEQGLIHAVDPVCTHARCIVNWNSAEKSWDCPCHGARYAPNGKVLTGPARKDLQLIQWKSLQGD